MEASLYPRLNGYCFEHGELLLTEELLAEDIAVDGVRVRGIHTLVDATTYRLFGPLLGKAGDFLYNYSPMVFHASRVYSRCGSITFTAAPDFPCWAGLRTLLLSAPHAAAKLEMQSAAISRGMYVSTHAHALTHTCAYMHIRTSVLAHTHTHTHMCACRSGLDCAAAAPRLQDDAVHWLHCP